MEKNDGERKEQITRYRKISHLNRRFVVEEIRIAGAIEALEALLGCMKQDQEKMNEIVPTPKNMLTKQALDAYNSLNKEQAVEAGCLYMNVRMCGLISGIIKAFKT